MNNDEEKLSAFICSVIKQKNNFLKQYLKGLGTLKEECFYFLYSGKSIRTILACLCAKEIGLSIAKIIPFCASLELMHLYSIIHDDLPAMDNALKRRGKKSLHLVFGESAAILVGDLMQSKSYHILFKYYPKNYKLIDNFFILTSDKGLIKGQVLDISNKLKNPTLPQLINIYRLKTGALFSVATASAPLINDSSDAQIDIFKKIGEIFGISYQIKDDIEDKQDTLEPNIVKSVGIANAYKILDKYKKRLLKQTEKFYFLNKFTNIVFGGGDNVKYQEAEAESRKL